MQTFFQNIDTNFCFYFEYRSPGCCAVVADKKNKTCTLGSVQGHLSLEPKPNSVVYIQGKLTQENMSLSWLEAVYAFLWIVIFPMVMSLIVAENVSAEGINTTQTNLSNALSTAIDPACPNEDNYHSTISGDCYYIPDIDGSLLTRTWSEAFEFCQENSLNMWIIDSEVEEVQVKILWQTITGGQYNFRHK